jgi:hypothetical protein
MSGTLWSGALASLVVALARGLVNEKLIPPDAMRDLLLGMRREIAAENASEETLMVFDVLADLIRPDAPPPHGYRLH